MVGGVKPSGVVSQNTFGLMELSSKSYNSSRIYSIFVKFGEPLDKLITK